MEMFGEINVLRIATFGDKTRLFLLKARGSYRMFRGYCPKCNSDAPEVDECIVCNNTDADIFPPTKETVAHWGMRYLDYLEKHYG